MGPGHPECPARLDAIDDYLLASGLDVAVERHEAPLVDLDDVALAHERGYVNELGDLLEHVQADGRMRALDLFWVRSGERAEGVTSALPKLDRDFSRLLGMELSPGELVVERDVPRAGHGRRRRPRRHLQAAPG